MHWKLKSLVQNFVSLLPSSASYATYYWIQRHFGSLKYVNPLNRLSAGIETWLLVKEQNCDPCGKTFLEIGTGRVPIVPLAYWLMGARKVVTIDLNPYLKEELIRECLDYIYNNKLQIQTLFGELLNIERFNALLDFSINSHFSIGAFLNLCKIEYFAPGNATKIDLPLECIDFHTSYTVFEHIPIEVLKQILIEGNRIISKTGLFVHRIDYSDHFAHTDNTISDINFLQYPEDEWKWFAQNRYMYMNRLRHDDYISLFESIGQDILVVKPDINGRSLELLRSGKLLLTDRFRAKSAEINSISSSWIVSRKSDS